MFRYWVLIDYDLITLEDNDWRLPINLFQRSRGELYMSYDGSYLLAIL